MRFSSLFFQLLDVVQLILFCTIESEAADIADVLGYEIVWIKKK